METVKVLAILQARMGSTRLPGKVVSELHGKPMILRQLERVHRCQHIGHLVVAITVDKSDDELAAILEASHEEIFRGSVDDVLSRFYDAARQYNPEHIVRLTADCPLTEPAVIDLAIEQHLREGNDYTSNTLDVSYPDGLDVEVMTIDTLRHVYKHAIHAHEREHVTQYIFQHKADFKLGRLQNDTDLSAMRWTVDESDDFAFVSRVYDALYDQKPRFTMHDILQLLDKNPELQQINQHLPRNAGAEMSKGQKLWSRAKRVIPGGNMLLSKRPDMFLPDRWPVYFSRSKGCRVWDLEDRSYVDMSLMGVGTNILGYGHPKVDEAVSKVVSSGNMSTLNCPEEVYLAERLVEMHPWADMVRFARTGGEANAVSIRIARAAAGKDKVAICGYHGWHDWYLAANLGDDERLAGHLLPGLQPDGVPGHLKGSVLPFEYNNFEQLQDLVSRHDVGVIKMEVSRSHGPTNDFLQRVRKLATDQKIVLIFDECTSGFRQTFGGLHKLYGVEPDIAVFGKALGNGYAITAVVGRREVMDAAQSTFISSTFWTERIGPAAALATLDVMEEMESWNVITDIGKRIMSGWQELAERHQLDINVNGIPALANLTFNGDSHLAYKTLLTGRMLDAGYLASTALYACVEHRSEVLQAYFEAIEPVFELIAECEDGRNVTELLEGPVCSSGFRRLN